MVEVVTIQSAKLCIDHEVKMAAGGAEALQLLSSFEPELILLDMKMPGMNGLETLE
jgi:two-component system response regulator (stage 0 sporulation protein F)